MRKKKTCLLGIKEHQRTSGPAGAVVWGFWDGRFKSGSPPFVREQSAPRNARSPNASIGSLWRKWLISNGIKVRGRNGERTDHLSKFVLQRGCHRFSGAAD